MKLLLAITGASGAIYARQFLDVVLSQPSVQLFVTASAHAVRIFKEEQGLDLATYVPHLYSPKDFDVPYVSGSARLDAMVILPCSMGTAGRIAHGISDDGITRAADVFLKEKRKLVLAVRETPLNLIHLRNLTQLAEAGATILPATPSFYGGQRTLEEATFTVVSRILDHVGVAHSAAPRWQSEA